MAELSPGGVAEVVAWLAAQPKTIDGKVDIQIVVAEGRKRGYCICPRPLREIVNFQGLTCKWCLMPEMQASYDFWYKPINSP